MEIMKFFFHKITVTGELTVAAIIFRIFVSLCIGGILGAERGIKNRPAGFMTYVLVSVGATIYMLTNQYITTVIPGSDPTRFGAQVISGIGFLGAGTIIVTRQNEIRGLTTAAGLWVAASLGLAVGTGFYSGAFIGILFTVFALVLLKKIDVYIKQHARSMEIYIEHNIEFSFRNLVDYIGKRGFDVFEMQRSKIKTLDKDLGVLIFSLDLVKKVNHQEVLNHLNEIEGIEYVKEIA